MKKFRLFLTFFYALLTSMTAFAIDGETENDGVSVNFKVPSPCAAITDNMVIADITVDRAYYQVYWTITCATDPDYFFGGSCGLTGQGAGTYTIIAYTPSAEPVELNSGNTYTFTFQTCEFGWDPYQTVATYEVEGNGAEAEVFSDITIIDFDGEMGNLGYKYKPSYSFTFSDAVMDVEAFAPLGMDGTKKFSVSKLDAANTWSADVSSMASNEGGFELHITARDAATGLRLRGTFGIDHSFAYNIYVSSSTPDDSGQDNPDLPGQGDDQEGTFILQEGDNMLDLYQPVKATFKATDDCKVLIEAEDQLQVTYDGESYGFTYIPTNTPSNVCEIDGVKKGGIITLESGFVMNPLVRITTYTSGVAIPVELQGTNPKEGTDDFWHNNGVLDVTFSKEVYLTGAQLIIGNSSSDISILRVSSTVSLDMGELLNTVLETGVIRPGERFEVQLHGLCEASDHANLYNGDGILTLGYIAPQPQYGLKRTTVNGHALSTMGLNDYAFLSYYAPDGQDGLFVLEFESDVQSVEGTLLQMGNRDLDAQGKYYEGAVPFAIEGSKVLVDARGVLRTLSILFPAVVDVEGEPGESTDAGMGEYDRSHITLRVENVIDHNGNSFRAEQAGNLGSYSFYMNYKELTENVHFDGDDIQAGDEVVAGQTIRLWLSSSEVSFEGIAVDYLTLTGEESYELRRAMVSSWDSEPDPYEGVIFTLTIPEMPEVAVGQMVRVSLHNATSTTSGMPLDISIEFKAGDPMGIEQISTERTTSAWTLQGTRMPDTNLPAGLYMIGAKVVIVK